MKKIFLFLFGLLLCVSAFSQAEKAKYYIEGDYNITRGANNKFVYTLTNISSKGITFAPVDSIVGTVEDDESISFTFEKASTDCPEGFQGGLKFWKWQSNGKNNSWQRDSEVKNAEQNYETDKVMVVMLVLDCSTSLGDENFKKLQNSAIKFIDILYNSSPDGGVRLGIIGFNTMSNTDRMVHEIEPLTEQSKPEMVQFIRSLTLYNNTSLYYAMHKGANMIGDYVGRLGSVDRNKYDYACVVSFTDGYDNHSKDERIGIPDKGLDNPYFQYIRDNVVNKSIGGKALKSYVIAVKGNDVSEDNKLYKEVFQGISSDEPVLLSDFSQVEAQFEKMAQDLIKRWQNLTCYVPSAHKGRVRWTLGDYTDNNSNNRPVENTTTEEPKVKSTHKAFIGVNGALDFETASELSSRFFLGLGVGFDFAIPKNDKTAIGGMLSFKYDFGGPTHFGFGPLFIFKDYEVDPAFMLGLGLDLRCPTDKYGGFKKNRPEYQYTHFMHSNFGAGATLRLGFTTLFKKLYFFTDLSLGGFRNTYMSDIQTIQLTDEPVLNVDGVQMTNDLGEPLFWSHPESREKHLYFNFSLNVGYRF